MRRGAFFDGELAMKFLSGMRAGLLAIVALAGAVSVAHADSGTISIRIFKAGFIIGGSAGEGVLTFHGQRYPLSIGGLSYGFTFGASETRFHGTVSNINRPSDVNGVYGQAGAGAAIGAGAQAIVLANQSGAVLTLSGEQAGLIVSADLSGLALSLK
jgi:lipid-binding SYLF domain-containing protein